VSISLRDRIATVLVVTATLIYGLWLVGPLGGLTAGSIAMIVLALGFIASASAVVPGFAALLSGPRLYLALASFGGAVALTSGVLTVVRATGDTLAILVVMTIALWATATARHAHVHRTVAVWMG
jgi:hypothetical protein